MKSDDIGFFDPRAEFNVVERGLPHWTQPGTVCFITWRLGDSLPVTVLNRLDREIDDSLRRAGFDPTTDWKASLAERDATARGQIQWELFSIRDRFLDEGHGSCVLARRECSEIVEKSWKHFDEDRYFLTDSVVMPNHVHFMAAFAGQNSMLKQCTEWKRFMARQIHRLECGAGEFWQVDQFDHLIRSPEQFEHYRRYIRDNPLKASLDNECFRHFSKMLL